MNNFLLELLVEEIPSRLQAEAISEWQNIIINEFQRLKIVYNNVQAFISPRRMVFSADLEPTTLSYQEEKKGPQITAPQEVIEKFLKANHITKENCIEKTIDKKTFIFSNINHPSQQVTSLLGDIIKKSITSISWKKSMRWGDHSLYFVRPLRNILAVFNEKPLDISFDEIGLKSGNSTIGHRFLSPSTIVVKNLQDYMQKMNDAFVIVDSQKRRDIILSQIKSLESKYNFSVSISEDLIEEVVGLVEYPIVLLGKVPNNFMKLPDEVIITPMKIHQRYFPVYKDNKLAPYFVFVANNKTIDDGRTTIEGNERVLNTRLSDALFFFETDLQKPLETHLESLKKIEFNEKLGSVYDRIQRITSLCHLSFNQLKARNSFITSEMENLLVRAANLAKCDLSTNMVYEFTELQGIMGAHYARIQGENPLVCEALREQYNQGDDISSAFSAIFSLIDKVELITSFFAIGKEPTGSKDPFALRRAAISILKLIKKYNISIDIQELIKQAFSQLPGNDLNPNTNQKVMDFLKDRLKVLLKDSNIDHEIVIALLNHSDDILLIFQKAEVLNEFIKTEEGKRLLESYKRAKNIINENKDTEVSKYFLSESAETILYNVVLEFENNLSQIEKTELDSREKLKKELDASKPVEKAISIFFEKVLVNTGDPVVKQNRLNLLTRLVNSFSRIMPLL